MRLVPIRYTTDVEGMTRFYAALGLSVQATSRPGGWVEMRAPGTLAIHRTDAGNAGSCELAFEAEQPLEPVVERLRDAGFSPEGIVDESFGRSVRVRDSDGTWVQINESDRELYT